MWRTIPIALSCLLFFLTQSYGQDVFVPRELKAVAVNPATVKGPSSEVRVRKALPADEGTKGDEPAAKTAATQNRALKAEPVKEPQVKSPPVKEQPARATKSKTQTAKVEPVTSGAPGKPAAAPAKGQIAKTETTPSTAKTAPVKDKSTTTPMSKSQVAKTETVTPPANKIVPVKEQSPTAVTLKSQVAKTETVTPPAAKAASVKEQSATAMPPKSQVAKAETVTPPAAKVAPVKEQSSTEVKSKTQSAKVEVVTAPAKKSSTPVKEQPASSATKGQVAKAEPVTPPAAKTDSTKEQSTKQVAKAEPLKAPPAKSAAAKETASATTAKIEVTKAEAVKPPVVKEKSPNPTTPHVQSVKAEPAKVQPPQEPTVNVQLTNGPMETAFTKLADGFDFPVGRPEAEGYYKARGFRSGGHMGEDWDGIRGGDTDFKDPIYSIGDGIVVFARDVHLGWGNVVIVRHAYRESGTVKHIDSLYGHLHSIQVSRGQRVVRGQQVGTMGTAHGQYDAHLHLEIRKNLEIGMSRSKFQKNFSNYYDPSQFIASHRHLSGGGANFRVAMNTFTHDSAYHFDTARDFSSRKRSTAQSSAALKRAVSSTTH
jgi:murein DD-endopeptidase MepM/ murein hydrolase activator NlpD